MKTVVITGSARGFGFELAKEFLKNNCNVVICDLAKKSLEEANLELKKIETKAKVLSIKCDITIEKDVDNLISETIKLFKKVDIWINNAGVNQPNIPIWELDNKTINRLIDIDLKGTILCSNKIMPIMISQKFGQIFNVEGHGSNDVKLMGLSLYGTAKRAITYFTEALAFESQEKNTGVLVGKITPGIMITNFISTSLGDGTKIQLDEKTKKVYNILGDYPDTIAKFMVKKILENDKNNVKFTWLTNKKAAWRFATSFLNKKDYFNGR